LVSPCCAWLLLSNRTGFVGSGEFFSKNFRRRLLLTVLKKLVSRTVAAKTGDEFNRK